MTDRSFIKNTLDMMRESYDLGDEHLFAMWVLGDFHYGDDFSEISLNEIYQRTYALLEEGAPGDCKVDGYYYDADAATIYIYQTKWPSVATKKSDLNDALEVAQALQLMFSEIDTKESLPELRRALVDDLEEVIRAKGLIVLRPVTGGVWRSGYEKKVIQAAPNIQGCQVTVELYDAAALRARFASKNKDLKGKLVDFALYDGTTDPILNFPDQGISGMGDANVALVSAKSLAEIGRQYKDRIFEKNVRLFLGKGKRNKDILKTLEDDQGRRSFWYGHNGISILCDSMDLQGHKDKPKSIRVKNPQIVNGCQTTTTLGEYYSENESCAEDLPVLTRFILLKGNKEDKEEAAELIAYRTNSQTAVSDADLRANDPQQRLLQRKHKQFGKKWFYERKRGEWASLGKAGQRLYKEKDNAPRIVARDVYQQAWRSYIGTPAAAISKKNDVWVRGHGKGDDLYDQVFDDDRRACDAIMVCCLFEWYSQIFTKKQESMLCFDIHQGIEKYMNQIVRAKTLVVAHSLAIFGRTVRESYSDVGKYPEDHARLIIDSLYRGNSVRKKWNPSGKNKPWGVLEEFNTTLLQAWATYITNVVHKDEETVYSSLKRSNEVALSELWDIFEGLLAASKKDAITPK